MSKGGVDETTFRQEIERMLARGGWWPHHPPDDTPVATNKQIEQILELFPVKGTQYHDEMFAKIRFILEPPAWKRGQISLSRPDIYGLGVLGPTIVVECKVTESKVRVDEYLEPEKISDGQRSWLDAWKFQVGGLAALAVGTKEGDPRQAWLIPWDWYQRWEVAAIKEDLNFKLVLKNIPEEFRLIWNMGNPKWRWSLPAEHPFTYYVNPITDPYANVDWKKEYSLRFKHNKGE